jgi:hypothetical protein
MAGIVLVLLVVAACGAGAAPVPAGQGEGRDGAAPSAAPFAPDEGGDTVAPLDDAKIIRTGSLQLQVANVDEATGKARLAVAALGGYISSSQISSDGGEKVASITYRIPSDRWDEAIETLRGLATKVLYEQTDAVEVTSQIVDLDARITNLQASERALQAIAEQATRISDVLEVQARLSEVRGEIERLVAQKASLEDQVSYGTLTVTFGLDVVAVTQAVEKWDPADEVDRATASLVDLLQGIASAGIWFGIVWLPVLVALGVIAIVALVVLRRLGVVRRPATIVPPAPPAPTSEA